VLSLGAARAGHQHPQPSLGRTSHPEIPERGLARTRPPDKQESARGLVRIQEIAQRRALGIAAHHTNIPVHHDVTHTAGPFLRRSKVAGARHRTLSVDSSRQCQFDRTLVRGTAAPDPRASSARAGPRRLGARTVTQPRIRPVTSERRATVRGWRGGARSDPRCVWRRRSQGVQESRQPTLSPIGHVAGSDDGRRDPGSAARHSRRERLAASNAPGYARVWRRRVWWT
jgi:hypothetical protein